MKNSIKVYGILLAAGSSERMSGVDKIWAELKGKPVISYRVLLQFLSFDAVHRLV